MNRKQPKNKVSPIKPANVKNQSSQQKQQPVAKGSSSNSKTNPTASNQISTSVTLIEIKPKLSEEEIKQHESATRIQCKWRQFIAKQFLASLKSQKKDLDDKLSKLEQDAFLQMIKMEQEREEKKRLKKLKEKQLKQKREARRKKFLEAAYDGNLQEMKFLINDLEKEFETMAREDKQFMNEAKKKQTILALIDCKDMNNNTALSEAAAGGSAETCEFLLRNNADPNSKGAFGRTPLWRSAFAGHVECVQCLLSNGADPRIYSTDGQRVSDAATKDNLINLLANWDISLTERMLQQIDKTRRQMKQEQINSLEDRKKAAFQEYGKLNQEYEIVKNEMLKCNLELQRLHDEYLLNEQMYGPLIEKKETEKIELTLRYDDLREKTFKSRVHYKDLLAEVKKEKRQIKKSKMGVTDPTNDDEDDGDAEGEAATNEAEFNDDEEDDDGDDQVLKINIKEFDDMILRDLNNIVKNSTTKWPLIIDQSDQASTFLRYRDTNYLNCLDMQSMQMDKLRLALIGSIRYGKPFVIDLMQYDKELLETFKTICGQIDEKLFDELSNKTLLDKDRYLRLVKLEMDGKEYETQNFNPIRIKNFKILFLTSNPYPNDFLMKITLPVKIITSNKVSLDDLDF